MGFKKPNIASAYSAIRTSLGEIRSPYNDGWTQMACKEELYMLKCWLDLEYKKLETFPEEEKWEQKKILEILKQ
jgi:hypothetical protein